MQILQAIIQAEIATCRALFQEYADWLQVDLCFQGFTEELANLPGPYAPPLGRLLLAVESGEAAGCIALKQLEPGICELKRLYVRPAFRRTGLGRRLVQQIIEEARSIGYSTMRLDSLDRLEPAIRLYESLGFVRCTSYYDTPLVHTVFMELEL
jgi:GNAT superfamily N-acetyltransferase